MPYAVFQDLTIIELSSVLAGPAVGMFFAELGAKVIKIENSTTGGDVTRSWKHASEDSSNESSAYFHSINWNKKHLFKNLKESVDLAEVKELIASADIVIANYKEGSAEKLCMDYNSIKAFNPSIIYGMITAYGEGDPRPGFDALLQAETGWMHMNGQADGPPTKMPVALIDILAAHQLKEGILVALIHKLKTGKGSKVSVSLYDTAVASLANQASNFLNLDIVPHRKGSLHPNIAPYGEILTTKDDKLILLAIGNDEQFRKLCDGLDLSSLKDDERFTTNALRIKNRDQLFKELSEATRKLDSNSLDKMAAEKEIPIGRIRNLSELFSDKQSQNLILTQNEKDGTVSKRLKTTVFNLSH